MMKITLRAVVNHYDEGGLKIDVDCMIIKCLMKLNGISYFLVCSIKLGAWLFRWF